MGFRGVPGGRKMAFFQFFRARGQKNWNWGPGIPLVPSGSGGSVGCPPAKMTRWCRGRGKNRFYWPEASDRPPWSSRSKKPVFSTPAASTGQFCRGTPDRTPNSIRKTPILGVPGTPQLGFRRRPMYCTVFFCFVIHGSPADPQNRGFLTPGNPQFGHFRPPGTPILGVPGTPQGGSNWGVPGTPKIGVPGVENGPKLVPEGQKMAFFRHFGPGPKKCSAGSPCMTKQKNTVSYMARRRKKCNFSKTWGIPLKVVFFEKWPKMPFLAIFYNFAQNWGSGNQKLGFSIKKCHFLNPKKGVSGRVKKRGF